MNPLGSISDITLSVSKTVRLGSFGPTQYFDILTSPDLVRDKLKTKLEDKKIPFKIYITGSDNQPRRDHTIKILISLVCIFTGYFRVPKLL